MFYNNFICLEGCAAFFVRRANPEFSEYPNFLSSGNRPEKVNIKNEIKKCIIKTPSYKAV